MCFFIFLCSPGLYAAATAKIVKVKGKVYVKLEENAAWSSAQTGMELKDKSEVKTKPASECWIVFDKEGKNIIALKEKGLVGMQDIRGGKIALYQGRTISLIDNIKIFKKSKRRFEIKTPSAVVGVRGTGWDTEVEDEFSSASCFEGEIDVSGLDNRGNVTQTSKISKGYGARVSSRGVVGESFRLDEAAYQLWNEFQKGAEGIGKIIGSITNVAGGVTDGARSAYADEKTDNPFNR